MKSDLEKRFENILEEEKYVSGIYNKPFLIGVLFTFAIFIISNIISFAGTYYNEYIWSENDLYGKVSSVTICSKYEGFPFPIFNSFNSQEVSVIGVTLNIVVIAFFSFFFGFLFRFIWSKISYRFVKVK